MNFDVYPKKSMLIVALSGILFYGISYANNFYCHPDLNIGGMHEYSKLLNYSNDDAVPLIVQNNSDTTVRISPLGDDGRWDQFDYAGNDICLNNISSIELNPGAKGVLSMPMDRSFWLNAALYGHYCRYAFTAYGKTIGLKYSQSAVFEGDYGDCLMERNNTIPLDFDTYGALLITDNIHNLVVRNDSHFTIFIGRLDNAGKWQAGLVTRDYAGDNVCLNKDIIPESGIELKPGDANVLSTFIKNPDFWEDFPGGHYCRYTFTDNGKTIGVRYAQSGGGGGDGAYGIEGKNSMDVDFTTHRGILVINDK